MTNNKKVWDNNLNERIEMPSKMENFLNEIEKISKKYDLSISHEDGHGAFIIDDYDERNIEWLKAALKSYVE